MELKRINLSTGVITPDAPPFATGIMTLPLETWADLTDRGYPGVGYWPVVTIPPGFDPATQALGAEILTVDAAQQRVVRSFEVVAAPPPPVPQKVTRMQARIVLRRRGLFGAVEAYLNANKDTDPEAWEAWNNANDVYRYSALVVHLAALLGLTSDHMDDMFIEAETIEV